MINVVNGSGKPRLVVIQAQPFYVSGTGTTFDPAYVIESDGTVFNILSVIVSGTNQVIVQYDSMSQFPIGSYVKIASNVGSTPSLNGTHKVVALPAADKIQLDFVCSVAGAGGTVRLTPAFVERGFGVNRRLAVYPSTNESLIYAKVIGVDGPNNKILVDSWIGGTPANGKSFTSDGWVADLPYCQDLTETFTPNQIVHPKWGYTTATKHHSFAYEATLDYKDGMTGDDFLLLNPHLSLHPDDQLVLIPRLDAPQFNYRVFYNAAFDLAQFGKGLFQKKPVFKLKSKYPVTNFPMASGYGTHYATQYGKRL